MPNGGESPLESSASVEAAAKARVDCRAQKQLLERGPSENGRMTWVRPITEPRLCVGIQIRKEEEDAYGKGQASQFGMQPSW